MAIFPTVCSQAKGEWQIDSKHIWIVYDVPTNLNCYWFLMENGLCFALSRTKLIALQRQKKYMYIYIQMKGLNDHLISWQKVWKIKTKQQQKINLPLAISWYEPFHFELHKYFICWILRGGERERMVEWQGGKS